MRFVQNLGYWRGEAKMVKWLIALGVLALIVVFVIVGVVATYNNFVSLEQKVDAQWGQVENVYQRRADLIPNLVSSVKGAMAQEKAVFDSIAQARTKYGDASTTDEKVAATNELEGAIGRLLVIMENYPELKSIDTVNGLMAELAGTENRISVERRRYNETVQDYNTAIKKFPAKLLAGGRTAKPYFEAEEGADQVPDVEF